MSRIFVVGEDALTCALGEQLVAHVLPTWQLAKESINTHGITKLVPALPRYLQQAEHVHPVLCVADTDRQCPVDLLTQWLPHGAGPRFMFRLAVSEAESWLLADRQAFAAFLNIPEQNVPTDPDALQDPKQELLRLARRSRVREIRQEVVSSIDPQKPGTGYNVHLSRFVRQYWRAAQGVDRSASLSKAVLRLHAFGAANE